MVIDLLRHLLLSIGSLTHILAPAAFPGIVAVSVAITVTVAVNVAIPIASLPIPVTIGTPVNAAAAPTLCLTTVVTVAFAFAVPVAITIPSFARHGWLGARRRTAQGLGGANSPTSPGT